MAGDVGVMVLSALPNTLSGGPRYRQGFRIVKRECQGRCVSGHHGRAWVLDSRRRSGCSIADDARRSRCRWHRRWRPRASGGDGRHPASDVGCRPPGAARPHGPSAPGGSGVAGHGSSGPVAALPRRAGVVRALRDDQVLPLGEQVREVRPVDPGIRGGGELKEPRAHIQCTTSSTLSTAKTISTWATWSCERAWAAPIAGVLAERDVSGAPLGLGEGGSCAESRPTSPSHRVGSTGDP